MTAYYCCWTWKTGLNGLKKGIHSMNDTTGRLLVVEHRSFCFHSQVLTFTLMLCLSNKRGIMKFPKQLLNQNWENLPLFCGDYYPHSLFLAWSLWESESCGSRSSDWLFDNKLPTLWFDKCSLSFTGECTSALRGFEVSMGQLSMTSQGKQDTFTHKLVLSALQIHFN